MAEGAEVNVFDVAKYIIERCGIEGQLPITTWKLQKLVYYAQAWSVVWDDERLFGEKIEAWANGPVCPALYSVHRGQFKISDMKVGDSSRLSQTQRETVDEVIRYYGGKSAFYLSELTHQEQPWLTAREGLNPGEMGNQEITLESMADYYASL